MKPPVREMYEKSQIYQSLIIGALQNGVKVNDRQRFPTVAYVKLMDPWTSHKHSQQVNSIGGKRKEILDKCQKLMMLGETRMKLVSRSDLGVIMDLLRV
ncbi:hypothetical protein ANCDUO_23487, partial [Ancylostoma duodenale]